MHPQVILIMCTPGISMGLRLGCCRTGPLCAACVVALSWDRACCRVSTDLPHPHFKSHDNTSLLLQGHAIECRLNAEDPFKNFRPGPGRVVGYLPPGGPYVRMDSHLYADYLVSSLMHA